MLFRIEGLLDAQTSLPETSPFFICPNCFSVITSSFLVFIVLGIYNFVLTQGCSETYMWPFQNVPFKVLFIVEFEEVNTQKG
jgi:hypothetical protein